MKIEDNKIEIMGIGMIFKSMKKILIYFTAVLAFYLNINIPTLAAHKVPTIVVLSDSGHRNGTTYIICGAASDIIAEDIINEMNKTKRIKAPLLGENMSKITQKSLPLYHMTFFNEYKYNYNVDFINLKRVTRNIYADYVLLVTSGMDIQSQFLKETWWNKWGISSSQPVIPTYRLTTMLTLIDKKTYSVVWQDLYQRDLKAENADIAITQFSPSYSQLAKIKKYSKTMSEYVTMNIDRTVNPWIIPPEEPKSIEMRSRFLNEGTKIHYPAVNGEVVKQNFDEFKQDVKEFKKESQMKWETRKRQRLQKKHIENVRRLEKKQEIEIIKLNQKNEIKRQNDKRLFESIRNNIDDMTNTLPPPTEEELKIKPAVNIESVEQQGEPKVIQPIMNKSEYTQDKTKPAVNAQTKENLQNTKATQKPVSQQKKQELPKKERSVEPQNTEQQNSPQKHVPYYDWNLKNIYLEKIGKMSRL